MIELNRYPDNFNVNRDLYWVPRLLNIPVLLIWIVLAAKLGIASLWFVLILFAMVMLVQKYVRPLMPDWPKEKLFSGKLRLDETHIQVSGDKNQTISTETIMEFVLFIDYYKEFSTGGRDFSRTGNSMIFIKKSDDSTAVFKFNVPSEKQYNQLMKLMEIYKLKLPYFREYKPFEISHILHPDLSDRIVYRHSRSKNT